MSNKKLMKKMMIVSLSAIMVCGMGSSAFADTQALPNGTIVNQHGAKYLTESKGDKYSGWFIDPQEDWYYFNESDKTMKTGWQKIDGKEYFFQPVRDMGNYHFNNEEAKWKYAVNNKVPYGAMYVNTITPDGAKVDSSGAKVVVETATQTTNSNSSSKTDNVKNGWVSENGSWHYYENGTLAKSKWLNLKGKWYYVLADGAMVSNTWKEIGGKSYYFGLDGAMYVNATTPDGKKVDSIGNAISENMVSNSYINEYLQFLLSHCNWSETNKENTLNEFAFVDLNNDGTKEMVVIDNHYYLTDYFSADSGTMTYVFTYNAGVENIGKINSGYDGTSLKKGGNTLYLEVTLEKKEYSYTTDYLVDADNKLKEKQMQNLTDVNITWYELSKEQIISMIK